MTTRAKAIASALHWANEAEYRLQTAEGPGAATVLAAAAGARKQALMWATMAELLPETESEAIPEPCDHLCECGHPQHDHTTGSYCNACDDPCEANSGHYPDTCPTGPPTDDPYAEVSPTAPLTRAAVRTVVLYVGSLVGWIDEVHGDVVDQITDAALAKISGPAPAACPDLPGHETHSPPCAFTGRPLLPSFGDRVRVSFLTMFDKHDPTGRYMLLEPAGTIVPDGATVDVIGRPGGTE